MGVIKRDKNTKIVRSKPPNHFREEDERKSAFDQVGYTPKRMCKNWYGDIYQFYQNNEC